MRDHAIVLARGLLFFLAGGTCISLLGAVLHPNGPRDTDLVNTLGAVLAGLLIYAATRTLSPASP